MKFLKRKREPFRNQKIEDDAFRELRVRVDVLEKAIREMNTLVTALDISAIYSTGQDVMDQINAVERARQERRPDAE